MDRRGRVGRRPELAGVAQGGVEEGCGAIDTQYLRGYPAAAAGPWPERPPAGVEGRRDYAGSLKGGLQMKIERHAPGAPCWVDLETTDQEAAKAFYGELFGWSYEDMPMDEAGHQRYSMASLGGSYAAAIYTQQDEQRQMGIPPHWSVHLTVDDVDATAGRVTELGGNLLMEPFDVFESGRMAVLSDPTGAAVALWQPRNHVGAGVQYEPGAMVWCELMTTDPAAAAAFYTELLGLHSQSQTMEHGVEYTVLMAAGAPAAGLMALPDELRAMQIPPHWSVYFQVADVDATVAAVTAGGGAVNMPPTDIATVGRIAFVRDPQGAGLGLMAPESTG